MLGRLRTYGGSDGAGSGERRGEREVNARGEEGVDKSWNVEWVMISVRSDDEGRNMDVGKHCTPPASPTSLK